MVRRYKLHSGCIIQIKRYLGLITQTRKYYFITLGVLVTLLFIWVDEVFVIINLEIISYKYQLFKIVLHTSIAYKLAKIVKAKMEGSSHLKAINPKHLFIVLFLLFNSYIITQYLSRTISYRIINSEVRSALSSKLTELDRSGTGYEAVGLSIKEYQELIKSKNLFDLPEEASDIYVLDWYGFQDYNRTVEFTLDPDYDLKAFFRDTSIANHLELVKGYYDQKLNKRIQLDTIYSKRYRWDIFET